MKGLSSFQQVRGCRGACKEQSQCELRIGGSDGRVTQRVDLKKTDKKNKRDQKLNDRTSENIISIVIRDC